MENLKALQDELIYQKQVIEDKSGYVTVANTNPSPFEITEGIKSIPSSDLSIATATEADVSYGKTFFSGNSVLKTGTAQLDPVKVDALFMFKANENFTEDTIYYTMPAGVTQIRKYSFYKNSHHIDFTFNDDVEKIDTYAFNNTKNFTFHNFENLSKLKTVGDYAFGSASCAGIDFANLPNSIESIASYCFDNTTNMSLDFKFPNNLKSLGSYAFRQNNRFVANNLDLSNYKIDRLPAYVFYYFAFNCDMTIPLSVKTINAYFNYNGCFKNIDIGSHVTSVEAYSFGSNSANPISDFYCQSITIHCETIPFFGSKPFAVQNLEHDFKIYVPDTLVEEYKAVSNLQLYVDAICPMSEKE